MSGMAGGGRLDRDGRRMAAKNKCDVVFWNQKLVKIFGSVFAQRDVRVLHIVYLFSAMPRREIECSCPILPSVTQYRKQQYQKLIALLQEYINEPHSSQVVKKLLKHVPLADQRVIMGSMMLYLLQTRRNSNDDHRILGILAVCPAAATFHDFEVMNAVHYFCTTHAAGTDNLSVLFTLLEAFPNLPRLQNKFGESPLHQLLGQNRPDPRILRAFMKMCPEAFR